VTYPQDVKIAIKRENLAMDPPKSLIAALSAVTPRTFLYGIRALEADYVIPYNKKEKIPDWGLFLAIFHRPAVWIGFKEQEGEKTQLEKKIISKPSKTANERKKDDRAVEDSTEKVKKFKGRKGKKEEVSSGDAKKAVSKAKSAKGLDGLYKELLNKYNLGSILEDALGCLEDFTGPIDERMKEYAKSKAEEVVNKVDSSGEFPDIGDPEEGLASEYVKFKDGEVDFTIPLPEVPTVTLPDDISTDDPTGGMFKRLEDAIKSALKKSLLQRVQDALSVDDCSDLSKFVNGDVLSEFQEILSDAVESLMEIAEEIQSAIDRVVDMFQDLMGPFDVECVTARSLADLILSLSESLPPADMTMILRGGWSPEVQVAVLSFVDSLDCDMPDSYDFYEVVFQEFGDAIGNESLAEMDALLDEERVPEDFAYGDKIQCKSAYFNFVEWMRKMGYDDDKIQCIIDHDQEKKSDQLEKIFDLMASEEEVSVSNEVVQGIIADDPSYVEMLRSMFDSSFGSVFEQHDVAVSRYLEGLAEFSSDPAAAGALFEDPQEFELGGQTASVDLQGEYVNRMGFGDAGSGNPVNLGNDQSREPSYLTTFKEMAVWNVGLGVTSDESEDRYEITFSPTSAPSDRYQVTYTEHDAQSMENPAWISASVDYSRETGVSDADGPITEEKHGEMYKVPVAKECRVCSDVEQYLRDNFPGIVEGNRPSPIVKVEEDVPDLWQDPNETVVPTAHLIPIGPTGNGISLKRAVFAENLLKGMPNVPGREGYFRDYFRTSLYNKIVERQVKEMVNDIRENPFFSTWPTHTDKDGNAVESEGIEIFANMISKTEQFSCPEGDCGIWSREVLREMCVDAFLALKRQGKNIDISVMNKIGSVALSARSAIFELFVSVPYFIEQAYDQEYGFRVVASLIADKILDGVFDAVDDAYEAFWAKGDIEDQELDDNFSEGGHGEIENRTRRKLVALVVADLERFVPAMQGLINSKKRRKFESFLTDEMWVRNYSGYQNNTNALGSIFLGDFVTQYAWIKQGGLSISLHEDLYLSVWHESPNGDREMVELFGATHGKWMQNDNTVVNYTPTSNTPIYQIPQEHKIGMTMNFGIFHKELNHNTDMTQRSTDICVEIPLFEVVIEEDDELPKLNRSRPYSRSREEQILLALREKIFSSLDYKVMFRFLFPFQEMFESLNILSFETIMNSTRLRDMFGGTTEQVVASYAVVSSSSRS
jgi:hypothetical protein